MHTKKTDFTLRKNYTNNWLFLVEEYQLVKDKKHSLFSTVSELLKAHNISRQIFYKYYKRYKSNPDVEQLLPKKRGPKWNTRRPDIDIEQKVVDQRQKGLNKYEIYNILLPQLREKTPSHTGIYNIFKRYNMNKLQEKQKEVKKQIIKEKSGELGHMDCHYLSTDIILGKRRRYYLFTLIDSYSRLAWTELLPNIKSLTTMFAALKSINTLDMLYGIKFQEMLTDNGTEFSGRSEKGKENHPFERLLLEIGVKHKYTRPYRPQTNGKVERYWRTIKEDFIEGTTFESEDELREELQKYMFYYNEHRPHQALGGLTPKEFHQKNLSSN